MASKHNNSLWDTHFELLIDYKNTHNHILIPRRDSYKDVALGNWLSQQRYLNNKGKLLAYRKEKLDSLGMIWDVVSYQKELNPKKITISKDENWMLMYDMLKDFYERHGHSIVPKGYTCNNRSLYSWWVSQRLKFRNNKLEPYQIELLKQIEMPLSTTSTVSTSFYEKAFYYYIKKYYPNTMDQTSDFPFRIDVFTPETSIALEFDGAPHKTKKKKLSDEKNNQLCENEASIAKLIRIRQKGLPLLDTSNLNNKDFLVTYTLDNYNIKTLNSVVKTVLSNEYHIQEPDVNIQRDSDQINEYLDSYLQQSWFLYYNLAREYYKQYGHLRIPQDYIIDNKNLGYWICTQRGTYKTQRTGCRLTNAQIKLLDKIEMVWDIFEEDWNENYEIAKSFYEKHHHLMIKSDQVIHDKNIGLWLLNQKASKQRGDLSDVRISLLNDIGIIWDFRDHRWFLFYEAAADYYTIHGSLDMPAKYVTENGLALADWLYRMKRNFHRMGTDNPNPRFTQEKMDLLNKLSMKWD